MTCFIVGDHSTVETLSSYMNSLPVVLRGHNQSLIENGPDRYGKVKVAKGAFIDFGSSWAQSKVNDILGNSPSAYKYSTIAIDYGFGVYNQSGNNKRTAIGLGIKDIIMSSITPPIGIYQFLKTALTGEDKLTRDGINAGKKVFR